MKEDITIDEQIEFLRKSVYYQELECTISEEDKSKYDRVISSLETLRDTDIIRTSINLTEKTASITIGKRFAFGINEENWESLKTHIDTNFKETNKSE